MMSLDQIDEAIDSCSLSLSMVLKRAMCHFSAPHGDAIPICSWECSRRCFYAWDGGTVKVAP